MLTVLDLFSGIGGFSLGLERTGGFKTVAFCEIDPFCRKVLAKHWPGVPCIEDVTTAEFTPGQADFIVGGFPCQDVSLAGRRAGLAGERSGLYRELVRAIRVVRPRHAIVENVAALLSDGMGTVLGDLAESGVDAEWDCVPAFTVGAPHERDRVWIVTHAHDLDGRSGAGGQDGAQAGDGLEGRAAAGNASDDTGDGCGQRRPGRPPDSFAGIREQTRRYSADPYGARLAFREGIGGDAWEKLSPVERDAISHERQSVWPHEPALSGVDDGIPNWMDRVRATGNTVLPAIPEIIAKTILKAEGLTA